MILSQWVLDYRPVRSHRSAQPASFLLALDPLVSQSLPVAYSPPVAHSPVAHSPAASFRAHSSRHPRPVNAQTLDEWHECMGHLYPEALLHLPQTTSGTEVTTSQLLNPKCENCCLSNSAKRLYRHAVIRSDVPFFRVSWDIVYHKDSLHLHFFDQCSRMHFLYTLWSRDGSVLVDAFRRFWNYAKNRWGFEIKILHGDGERTAVDGDLFDEFIAEKGIQVETSPPHTHDQNGDAERSGGVITARARNMAISSNLPESLANEIAAAACYLLNRSLTKALKWLTPIGFLKQYIGESQPHPSLNHLVPYGCRAYSFIHNRPKNNKLTPRAHIGYLCGYDSTNVFRIWIPSQKTVISTRDVIFDRSKRYDLKDDPSFATEEVIETIRCLTLDVEVDLKD